MKHTYDVFLAATEMAVAGGNNSEDIQILQLATLFHDTGYLFEYTGHEEKSKLIAANFLLREDCPEALIDGVVDAIDATKVPQQPQNDIQRIICDADLFHLAHPDYPNFANCLRNEWAVHLKKEFTDDEWRINNLKFMQQHHYFTEYGIHTLNTLKLQNLPNLFVHQND
ncbi:HD domain-containing protein [Mucilaginibacter segetis]|uniref:HD domain-containing protein n=1 Tax=Mucilaginibacter segetis TaxID=2793071 RepID=UPI001BE40329|nr:HD domain-containing protein [Mucilaginibacter segetis]